MKHSILKNFIFLIPCVYLYGCATEGLSNFPVEPDQAKEKILNSEQKTNVSIVYLFEADEYSRLLTLPIYNHWFINDVEVGITSPDTFIAVYLKPGKYDIYGKYSSHNHFEKLRIEVSAGRKYYFTVNNPATIFSSSKVERVDEDKGIQAIKLRKLSSFQKNYQW